jgi:hypothetical protein
MGNNTATPRIVAILAEKGLKGVKDSSFDVTEYFTW